MELSWDMIFSGWSQLGRTAIIGCLAYVALVILLRISGKRTLSKWNAFDLVVTVAFGSSLATALLSNDVSLVQGVLAFALLIVLQLVITWLSVRSPLVRRLAKSEPALLVYHGTFQQSTMRRERVPEAEVRAAIRRQGIASVEAVDAVVLETDGSFSIIKSLGDGTASALGDVVGFPDAHAERDETAERADAASSPIVPPLLRT